MPEDMSEASVASLYKKGDPNAQENYRPISLLNLFFKIIATVLKWRLEEGLEKLIMDTQYGLRREKSTLHALHIARRIQEYAERAGLPGTMVFLDWGNAFDKISHEWLMHVIESYRIPDKFTGLIAHIYENPMFKVEIDGSSSDWHKQSSGIRQGCSLSSYLFILVMNCVFEQVESLRGSLCKDLFGAKFEYVEMPNVDFAEILFADDTVILPSKDHRWKYCCGQLRQSQEYMALG